MNQLHTEFDRQVQTLLVKSYPNIENLIKPLRKEVSHLLLPKVDFEKGRLPFVIVMKHEVMAINRMMTLVELEGKQGVVKMYPHELEDFKPIEEVEFPKEKVYLLMDIDRGKETLNVPPKEAFDIIKTRQRTPLTIEEGIAIITHYPEFLQKNNCFSLLASRIPGDKRVPAIWINAQKHPNLGWCWEGNPHTWLGSASANARVSV